MSILSVKHWLGVDLNPQINFSAFFKQMKHEMRDCSNEEGTLVVKYGKKGEITGYDYGGKKPVANDDPRNWLLIKLDKLGNVAHTNPLETLITTIMLFVLGKFYFTSMLSYGICYAGVLAFGVALGENKPAFMARVIEELTNCHYDEHHTLKEYDHEKDCLETRIERAIHCKILFPEGQTVPVKLPQEPVSQTAV